MRLCIILAAGLAAMLASPAIADTAKGKPIVSESGITALHGVAFGGIGEPKALPPH